MGTLPRIIRVHGHMEDALIDQREKSLSENCGLGEAVELRHILSVDYARPRPKTEHEYLY